MRGLLSTYQRCGVLLNSLATRRKALIGIIYGGALSSRDFVLEQANKQLYELENSIEQRIIPEAYRAYFSF